MMGRGQGGDMTLRSLYFAVLVIGALSAWSFSAYAQTQAQTQAQNACDAPRPHADYTACEFFGKNFDGADFTKSDFSGVNMMNFKCRRCVFECAVMHTSDTKRSDFSESSFGEDHMREADLVSTRFAYSPLTGATLSRSCAVATELHSAQAQ